MAVRRRVRIEVRIHILALLILCGIGGIIARLWWVQVAHGALWSAKIGSRTQVTVRIPSVRGEIRDRNGITLVQNRASYEVDFYLPEMVRGYRERNGGVPVVAYTATVKSMRNKRTIANIVQIVNTGVIPRLQELDLARDYSAQSLSQHYRTDDQVPFTYLEDIDFPTIAKFSEHDVGLPGVDISPKPVRQYIYGALAAHLLGYVGAPLEIDKLPDAKEFNFYQADVEGKSQVELYMDKYLRGAPGRRVLQRSVKNIIEGEVSREPPTPGDNVYLTIDARIQAIAEDALRAAGRASVVVVNPNNGDILAMASVPSYDPNTFIPSISGKDWSALLDDKADPLVNRSISAFPPGSTFKIVTSLAGLRKGLANKEFTCTGGVMYGNHYFKCWIAEKGGAHGTLSLADAIKVSCNAFFYQYGNAAGITAIDDTAKLVGLGQKSGIELTDEAAGVIPGPEWMALNHSAEKWSNAQTANVSIGQGYDLVTPLQSAMVVATVANGGIAYYPRLIDRVLTPEGKPALDEDGNPAVPPGPRVRADLRHDFTASQIELVRHGLWKVVNEVGGTGSAGRLKGVQVAGKTGTAQAMLNGKKDTIAWYTCFAPYDHPRYAMTVMVQGGEHGGSVAAPIATHILEQCLAMDAGSYTPKLAALAPAHKKDPFQMIAKIDYKATGITLDGAASADPEDADSTEPAHDEEVQKVSARPEIRQAPDAQGKVRRTTQAPQPQQQQEERRNMFQRLFGLKARPPVDAPPPPPGPRIHSH